MSASTSEEQLPATAQALPWKWGLVGGLLGLASFGLLRLAALDPGRTERWFSRGLYPWIERGLTSVSGRLPFSLAEVLLLGGCLAALILVMRDLRRWRVRRMRGSHLTGKWCLRLIGGAGILYALFVGLWGLNHARLPYAEHAALRVDSSTTAELASLVSELIESCNRYREEIEPEDLLAIRDDPRVQAAMVALGEKVPVLAGQRSSNLRRPWISPVLSLLGITGIYSPFTAEAHLNASQPLVTQLFTACHEEAHARGFAREDEANFIAWQACHVSGDPALRYSASYVALALTERALLQVDPPLARALLEALAERVIQDRGASQRYWRSRRSRASAIAQATNDLYLKSQGQSDGTASYGQMVELLLAERRGLSR